MTNFEKIKAMTEEEFLKCIMTCPHEFNYLGSEAWCKEHCDANGNCKDCCLSWLRSEAVE